MNGKYIFLFFGVMFVAIILSQAYNTLTYESQFKEPTAEEYYHAYLRPDDGPANIYSAYTEGWRTHANVNPVFPALFLTSFFGWIGYMYYKDWEIGRMKNVRNYLGVRTNGL